MTVSILGAGAFGTALAICLSKVAPVTLWSRDVEYTMTMSNERQNPKRLAGCYFPDSLSVTSSLQDACRAEVLLLAVPMQQLHDFVGENKENLQNSTLVACCKGMDIKTGLGPLDIISQVLGDCGPALLTGPSFASDIATGLPTGLTLACQNEAVGRDLQQKLSTQTLRLYRTQDTVGASLGGALKNVIAIACGATMGAGLGESARAAIMTRGFAEILRLALKLGADAKTLSGLSGFGDLVLTCTSDQSRNYKLGLSIGARTDFDPNTTVEGAATALAAANIAHDIGIDMPITSAVAGLVEKRLDVTEAMNELLSRTLKEE